MPRVRVLLPVSYEGRTRQHGETVDLPAEVATYLREQGRVELVRGEHPDTPERAETPESTTRRTRTRRSTP